MNDPINAELMINNIITVLIVKCIVKPILKTINWEYNYANNTEMGTKFEYDSYIFRLVNR